MLCACAHAVLLGSRDHVVCRYRPDRLTHHPYSSPRRRIDSIHYDLFEDNLEREFGTEDYGLGQVGLLMCVCVWGVGVESEFGMDYCNQVG